VTIEPKVTGKYYTFNHTFKNSERVRLAVFGKEFQTLTDAR